LSKSHGQHSHEREKNGFSEGQDFTVHKIVDGKISRRRTRERLGAGRKISRGKNIAQAHAGEIASLKRAGKLTKRQYVEASIFYADKRRKDTRKLTKKLLDREMYF